MLEPAIARYESGDLAGAAPLFIAVLAASPNIEQAWLHLALILLRQGATAQLLGLVELRQQQRKDALGFFYDVLGECVRAGHGAAIPPIAAALPGNSALGVILGFFSGCLAARGGDWQRAIAALKTAAIGAQHCGALFADDPRLYSIQSQGHIFEDASFLDGIGARRWDQVVAGTRALRPALDRMSCPATTAPFVYLVSCNPLYLRRFGETITASCAGAGIATALHFHIVDPDDATETILGRLRARCHGVTIGWSSEMYRADDGGYRRAGYYACARFLRAREIADTYGRDLLILDADTEALGDVGALVAGMQAADLGYFSCGDTAAMASLPRGRRLHPPHRCGPGLHGRDAQIHRGQSGAGRLLGPRSGGALLRLALLRRSRRAALPRAIPCARLHARSVRALGEQRYREARLAQIGESRVRGGCVGTSGRFRRHRQRPLGVDSVAKAAGSFCNTIISEADMAPDYPLPANAVPLHFMPHDKPRLV